MYAIVSIFLDDNCYLKLARFLTAVDISCQVSATEGAGRPSQYRYCIFLRWFCVKQGQISALHHQECFLGMASQLSCGCLEAGSQRTRGIRSEPIIHIYICPPAAEHEGTGCSSTEPAQVPQHLGLRVCSFQLAQPT